MAAAGKGAALPLSQALVVRFSLRLNPNWCTRAYGDEANRPAWLAHRAGIFRRTLWQSLIRQTRPVTAVLLLCDEGDAEILPPLFGFARGRVELIFGRSTTPYDAARARLEALPGPLAVSRIDSDDLVATDYFDRVASAVAEARGRGQASGHVVATDGYRSDLRTIQRLFYPFSPFFTWFGDSYAGANIYGFDHSEGPSTPSIAIADAHWLQYLHATNVSNIFAPGVASFEMFQSRLDRSGGRIGSWHRPVADVWPATFPPLTTILDQSQTDPAMPDL